MDIQNKNIIVTGGAKGIGKTIAIKLLEENANVGIFDIDEKELNKIKTQFPEIYVKKCDVSEKQQVKQSIDDFFLKFNQIDALINNAALVYNSPTVSFSQGGFKFHDLQKWDEVISTDLNSVFYMSIGVIEKMIIKRTKGIIINISSISSTGNAGQPAYSAAKAGVNALTVAMSKELSSFKIRVAGIAPGYAETNTTVNSMSESVIKDIKKRIPLRRLATLEEITEGVLFILKNEYFNGKILELDGGLRI